MVEYYRGLCTFEDAVNAVEETGLATSQAINNLETGITNAIQEMALGLRTDIQQNSYAIVASHQMLADSFEHGFNSINNTLNFGFDYLGNKIDVLSDKICSKLDKIHDILDNPRFTASRELYRNALKDFQNRYYEEALENCIGAIEKNKTDYISWFLLGMIYFCGKSKFSNVRDINKAEDAFFNAAKYVDAVVGKTEEANIFASAIYYYLGHIRLIISNDYLIENKIEESNKKLLEAEEASRTSYQLSKENLLARYEQAKHLHFLTKDAESLKLLEELIRAEKNFAIKAVNDKNFESLWTDIQKIIERLKLEVCNQISDKLKENINFYENKLKADDEIANYVISWYPWNHVDSNIEVFQKQAHLFQQKYSDIEKKDYFSVLVLKEEFSVDLENFGGEITGLIDEAKDKIEQKREEEEERRKKNELLKRFEALEQTLPSLYKLEYLVSFIKSHRARLTGWEFDRGFDEYFKNRTGTDASSAESDVAYLLASIDAVKKFPSVQNLERICKVIEKVPLYLDVEREWEKIKRKERLSKIMPRIIIGLIIGVIVGFIGIYIFDEVSGIVIPSIITGCVIAGIWHLINWGAFSDKEDTSYIKALGVAIMCFIVCIIFIYTGSELVRIIMSSVLFTLLAVFLKR